MSKTNPKTLKVRSVVPGTGEQLAKVKKLITANNADSFALAVELVRTLELDNEATWLALLGKTKIVQLVKLHDNRVTNLLLEIAGTGKGIKTIIFGNLPPGRRGGFDLSGLTSLSDAAAQALAQHEGKIHLYGLTSLSDAAAQALAKHKGELDLDGLTSLSDAAAQALAQNEGTLRLSGLTSLSDAAAQALAQYKGELHLGGLTSLSDAAAQALAQHEGNLHLYDLTSLSDSPRHVALAQKLAQNEGLLGLLTLGRLMSLSDAAAQALAQYKGELHLGGLTSLSDAAAQALAQHEGNLGLGGLTSLSDAAAQALAKHKGEICLSGVAREKVDRSLRRLTGARLFESENSDSSKFWDTELRGAELVVRFGRLGTDGQEKIKAFPDAAAAATEQAKLIKEKLGKGYKEV